MSVQDYGAASRKPVYSGKRRVQGLYERRLVDGSIRFEAALRLGGTPRRQRLQATTKTDAIAELRALQTDYARGVARQPSGVTLAELAEEFLAHLQSRVADPSPRRRRSPRTVTDRRYKLEAFVLPLLGDTPAGNLELLDVLRLLDHLAAYRSPRGKRPLAPSTRTGVVTAFSALVRYGVKRGLIERNVVRDLDRDDRPGAKRATEPRYLTADEVRALLGNLSDVFRPLVAACAYAGLRVSETLGLVWGDLDLSGDMLTVSAQLAPDGTRAPLKTTASAATVPLLPELKRQLQAHRRRQAGRSLSFVRADALVFSTPSGKPQGRRNVLRAVYAAGDAAGLNPEGREKVGLHDLRHSFVALALTSGLTLPEAATLARHASPAVTAALYAGLSDESRRELGSRLAVAFGG
jgi:integrase